MIRSAAIKKDFAFVLAAIAVLSILTVVLTLRGQLGKSDGNAPDLSELSGEQDKEKDQDKPKEITTPSGLKYIEVKEGIGDKAMIGHIVQVHYTGRFQNGQKFDSSEGKAPYTFRLGKGEVIAGWDEGIKGMKVGGKRKLMVPYKLAYGEQGRPPQIPPKSDLNFDVELVNIRDR